jgi:hypothetical protein
MTTTSLHLCASVFACSCLVATRDLPADVPMAVTTSAFERVPLTVHSIGDAGIEGVDARGQSRHISLADLVAADRDDVALALAPGLILHVNGGFELPGEPAGLTDGGVVWHNPQLGELTIPLSAIRGIGKTGDKPQVTRSTQDVIRLNNGDLLKGILASANARTLTLQGDQGDVPVDWSNVAEISLAETGPATSPSAFAVGGHYRLGLRDGSIWPADGVTLENDRFAVRLRGGAVVNLASADIRSMEVEGGKITWLTRRSPAKADYTPFFQVSPARPAAYAMLNSLRVGGDAFRSAIRVRPLSRLAYDVPPDTASFRARYAIAGSAPLADVTVRVRGDEKVLYEQVHVKSGILSPPITADLAGIKVLILEVDYGANQDVQDDFLWLDPAFLRTEPK